MLDLVLFVALVAAAIAALLWALPSVIEWLVERNTLDAEPSQHVQITVDENHVAQAVPTPEEDEPSRGDLVYLDDHRGGPKGGAA